jgi:hypothetical protein
MNLKRRKRVLRVFVAIVSLIAFYAVYNQNRPQQYLNETNTFSKSIKLPKSQITQFNLQSPYAAIAPGGSGQPLYRKGKRIESANLFDNIDMKLLTGRLTELPVHKRIPINEKIEYHLLWNGIHAASATLSTSVDKKDNTKTVLRAVIRTHPVIQTVYPVNDIIISKVQASSGNTVKYDKRENEGRHQKQEIIDVDHVNHRARYRKIKLGKETRNVQYDVPKRIYDPLSVIYRIRSMDLEAFPDSITLDVLANKRVARAKLDQQPTVSKSTPMGIFECYVLSLDMNFPGLFDDIPEGSAFAYFDKHSHLLVKVEVSLSFGKISMLLVDWQKGQRAQ